MEQDKISKVIKSIRKKHNLTQKEFADKYGVTYQAVSKWENGINLPDMLLIKQMSKDFKVSLDDIFEGGYSNNNQKKTLRKYIILLFIIFLTIIGYLIYNHNKNNNFEFKILTSECNNFTISGNISYNDIKSAIFINNINYCGGDDKELYKKIECKLYESNNNIEKVISTYNYNEDESIILEDFLKEVNFVINNYSRVCKDYTEDSIFVIINATNNEDKITTYKIPLSLKEGELN